MLNRLLFILSLTLVFGSAGCKKESKEKAEPAAAKTEAAAESATATEVESDAVAEPVDQKEEEPSVAVIKKPFFFKVEGPDGQSGHLLGTMHMGIDAATELPKSVWDALEQAKGLTVEADITDLSLAKGLLLPPDQNLKDLLGEETWGLLVEKLGEPASRMLLPMKPAAAASAIAVKGIPMTVPMDLALLGKAQETKKELHYLEDGAFQLAMLDKVMTVDTVREMLANPEATDMSKMLVTYRAGDAEALLVEMNDPKSLGKDGDKKMEALLYDRNANWIPKLESLFAAKGAFVAVGAAHLIGPRSVVDLLEKKGYTITRLTEE